MNSDLLNFSAPSAFQTDEWAGLRRHTSARIALGRAGGSAPTAALLAFNLDHALARDAVHAPFDAEKIAAELRALPAAPAVLTLSTAAPDRATYLQQPDLGRRLSSDSVSQLLAVNSQLPPDLVVLISDGLSALAAQRQAPPLLTELLPRLRAAGLTLAPLCVVRHARVALLDEVGAVLRARLALILLGERPGLGTPDSLGAYFEFAPQPGRTNADRNCVSNIRPGQPSWLAGLPKNSPSCSPPHSPPSAAASRSRKRSHRRCWHVESRFPRGRTARRPYRRYCARR
jgi:ethanolamine ammonia-lyase small subunit